MFKIKERGLIPVKGKGEMRTYFIIDQSPDVDSVTCSEEGDSITNRTSIVTVEGSDCGETEERISHQIGDTDKNTKIQQFINVTPGRAAKDTKIEQFTDVTPGGADKSTKIEQFTDVTPGGPEKDTKIEQFTDVTPGGAERDTKIEQFPHITPGGPDKDTKIQQFTDVTSGGAKHIQNRERKKSSLCIIV